LARRRGGSKIFPYSRAHRRPSRWGVGLPPRKPQSRWRRFVGRVLDPVFYLKAVILVSSAALIVLPLGADAINAALKPARNDKTACRILSVIDGDTLSIWCAGQGVQRARLTGFDAPELFSPRCTSELIAAQHATWALRGLIFDASTVDIAFEGRDRYGRALVMMRLDGKPVAVRMIDAGHGRAYGGGHRDGWCAS
jgi:micrococcal nuclease